jgi:16S rRNA (cytosine1402-N4)-methyltransferase
MTVTGAIGNQPREDMRPQSPASQHIPVLLAEILEGLQVRPGMRVIDCTLGGGSHTAAILECSAPDGQVLGLDADPAAVERVANRLSAEIANGRLQIVQVNFGELKQAAFAHNFAPVDAILFDLGVSSFQLETPERGFSFLYDGPLDMRFDLTQLFSASDIVNRWPERELADIIYRYGEEKRSRRIARALVHNRPIVTTGQLARLIEQAIGGRGGDRIHPATRTFQALRIAVNEELAQLERVLPQALEVLKRGGRMAVISFHSLEDRIVKQWMQREASAYIHDPTHPQGGCSKPSTLRVITHKPIMPSLAEIERNPRSRSAKLRIAERA